MESICCSQYLHELSFSKRLCLIEDEKERDSFVDVPNRSFKRFNQISNFCSTFIFASVPEPLIESIKTSS